MKSGYVYCLRFRSTQFYVGSSNNPAKRFSSHKTSCLGKNPNNKFMSRVWKKYGEPELYILSKVPVEFLLEEEQKFIDLVFGKEGCLNLNPKADKPIGWKKGKKQTIEHKTKVSASLKGKKRSAETKARMSVAQKGKVVSEEARVKISIAGLGRTPHNKGKKGPSPSAETLAKMSASNKNKKAVVGTRENETIEFSSIAEASRFIGRAEQGITRVIKGKRQTCGGYSWRYK